MAIEITTATENQKLGIRTALLSGTNYSIEAGSASGDSFFKLKAIRDYSTGDNEGPGDFNDENWDNAEYEAGEIEGGVIRINGISNEYVRGFFQWALDNVSNWASPLTCYINEESDNVLNITNVYVSSNRDSIPEVEIFVTQSPEVSAVVDSIYFQNLKFINKVENNGNNIDITAANRIRLTSIDQDIELRTSDDVRIRAGDELELHSQFSDVTIITNVDSDHENTWRFTNEGTFSQSVSSGFAGFMQWKGESSGDGNGYTTLELHPDQSRSSSDQYLIIDPTVPNHIHIRAGGTIDNSNAELILGGENANFKVSNGENPSVAINSGIDQNFIVTTSYTAMGSPPGPISSEFVFQADGVFTVPETITANYDLNLKNNGDGVIKLGYQETPVDIYIGTSGGNTRLDLNSDKIRILSDAPASSIGSSGDFTGAVALSGNYFYYCTQTYDGVTNIWKRVQFSNDTW
jgi:hypothetical protein